MSPASTTNSTTHVTSSSIYPVPKLNKDRLNWLLWKSQTMMTILAKWLLCHLQGWVTAPVSLPRSTDGTQIFLHDGKTPAPATDVEKNEDEIETYFQREAMILQQLYATVAKSIHYQIQGLLTATATWDKICQLHKGKSEIVQVDTRKQLQELRCNDGDDVKAHLTNMIKL